MKRKRNLLRKKETEANISVRRFIFAISTLPAILNLLAYALLISDLRMLLLALSGGAVIYFIFGYFFEIKDGEWGPFTIGCNTLLCILISILFPLAYKMYLWFVFIVIEIVLSVFAYIYRDKFGVSDK